MENSAIVDLYWQRSDRAIAETEQKYGAYCHRITYDICQCEENAEECVSDTWLAAWKAMPTEEVIRSTDFENKIDFCDIYIG